MKRNTATTRVAHLRTTAAAGRGKGSSKYAAKVAAGNQMYGDGKRGCAHRIRLNYWKGDKAQ